MRLMQEGGLPQDESAPDTIFLHSNGYSVWFISRETLDLGLTTPMSSEAVLELIEAREEAKTRRA
jgi:hypothetical protein